MRGRSALGLGLLLLAAGVGALAISRTGSPPVKEAGAAQARAAAPGRGSAADGSRPVLSTAPPKPPSLSPELLPLPEPGEEAVVRRGPLTVRILRDETPLVGATVRLRLGESETAFVTETTDAKGFVKFPDVDRAKTWLDVRAEGYQVSSTQLQSVGEEDGVATLSLEPGVGFVGHVVDDETGAPLSGASVALEATPQVDFGPTNREGRFRVPGVEAGCDVELVARAAGHVRTRVQFPVTKTAVVPAEPVIRLKQGGALVGVVLSAEGAPVPGARVRVEAYEEEAEDFVRQQQPTTSDGRPYSESVDRFDNDDSVFGSWANADVFDEVAGKDGTFRVDGLTLRATYRASAKAAGHAPSSWAIGLRPTSEQLEVRTTLSLRRASLVLVRVALPEGETLSDRARVRLFPGGELRIPEGRDPEGRFRFVDLEPGPAFAFLRTPGYAPLVEKVDIPDGGTLEVALRPSILATVEGVVTDTTGKPVAHAEVEVASVQANSWRAPGEPITRFLSHGFTGFADAEGRFRIAGVRAGDALVVARAEVDDEHLGVRDAVRVTAPAVGVKVTIFARGSLRVRLVDSEGSPIRGSVKYGLMEEHGGSGSESELRDGVFTDSDLEDGAYTLFLVPPDFAWLRLAAAIRDGGHLDLGTVAVSSGRRLEGRVRDSSGVVIGDVAVKCKEVPFGYSWTKADAEGRFALEHFPGTSEELSFERDGYCSEYVRVEPSVRSVEVRMLRPATMRGTVLGPDGTRAGTMGIHLRDSGSQAVRDTYGDFGWIGVSKGEFDSCVRPGKWVGVWTDDGGTEHEVGAWEIAEGATLQTTIHLPAK